MKTEKEKYPDRWALSRLRKIGSILRDDGIEIDSYHVTWSKIYAIVSEASKAKDRADGSK